MHLLNDITNLNKQNVGTIMAQTVFTPSQVLILLKENWLKNIYFVGKY